MANEASETLKTIKLSRAAGVAVGRRSGGQLTTTLVATISLTLLQ